MNAPAERAAPEILIVEDEPDLREGLAMLFADEGYRVSTAGDGAAALARLRQGPRPSLVLLDLMMPVMDGWQFRAHQLADPALARIPVIVLSGVVLDDTEAGTLRAMAYVRKPIRIGFLLDLLAKALPRHDPPG
jgi:CheY-like chemotaxis protein